MADIESQEVGDPYEEIYQAFTLTTNREASRIIIDLQDGFVDDRQVHSFPGSEPSTITDERIHTISRFVEQECKRFARQQGESHG